ncbi:hypothetical protein C8F01DRAFT_1083509 [Mycena amicta]|nr:hypothetical protein C8F01DRAFT_1083509 [Mycena amicta]
MSSSSPNATPPGSPAADLDQLSVLMQQLTPSKSQRQVSNIVSEMQMATNTIQENHRAIKRRIAELESHMAAEDRRGRKHGRGRRAEQADDDIPNATTIEDRIRHAVRHFCVEEAVWFVSEDVLDPEYDPDFDISMEFQPGAHSRFYRACGQSEAIKTYLPSDVRAHFPKKSWIGNVFLDGFKGQRSTIANHIRSEVLPYIVDKPFEFVTSANRVALHAKFIGYMPANNTRTAFYSSYNAEVLYDVYGGDLDFDHVFRGPILLNAIWLHSGDVQCADVGDQTQIDYAKRYTEYSGCIHVALQEQKVWALELMSYWDGIFFLTQATPLGTGFRATRKPRSTSSSHSMLFSMVLGLGRRCVVFLSFYKGWLRSAPPHNATRC